jgi:hypothetical protein
MVRTVLLALSCCLLMVAPASASAIPPHCQDSAWLTPVDEPLNLPAPQCTGLNNQVALEIVPGGEPVHGTIHSGVYVPATGYHGEDQVRYTVTDADSGKSNEFKIDLLVDTPPECTDMSVAVAADRSLVLPAPNCTDKESDDLVVSFGKAANGTITVSGRSLVYTPNPGFVGQDSFAFSAVEYDWGVESEDATMRISVTAPIKIVLPTPTPTPIPTPAPTPAPDTIAPVVTLKNASKKQAVAITLTRNENVKAKLTLTLDKATAKKLKLSSRTVGTLSSALTPGTSKLAVKWTAKAAKALKKVKKVSVTVTALVTDAAGNSTTKSLVLTLKK